jgi:hypothetical protein
MSSPLVSTVSTDPTTTVIRWPLSRLYPIQAEISLLPVLVKYPKETGSFCHQPEYRYPKVLKACNDNGMLLASALSLRRHHIKYNNPHFNDHRLNMGTPFEKKRAADAFEKVVADYFADEGIPYNDEEAQRLVNPPKRGVYHPGTPDFIFPTPLTIVDPDTDKSYAVNWVELKHFYGASTIPSDNATTAVGSLVPKMTKYTANFGPGALLFAYGCGDELASRLPEGVIVLDESIFDLNPVYVEVAKFCTRKSDGMLLP